MSKAYDARTRAVTGERACGGSRPERSEAKKRGKTHRGTLPFQCPCARELRAQVSSVMHSGLEIPYKWMYMP